MITPDQVTQYNRTNVGRPQDVTTMLWDMIKALELRVAKLERQLAQKSPSSAPQRG